ncbi:MAG: hypothetical protein ABIG39_01930 [Candidatus Micrarchaeota archaeon]
MEMKSVGRKGSPKARSAFCSKVVSAAKSAGFSPGEMGKLEQIISDSEERNEIISQAISTALDLADIPPDDMDMIISILEKAYDNIENGVEPFTQSTLKTLEKLLKNRVSDKALARMESNLSKPNKELIDSIKSSLEKRDRGKSKLKYTPKKR